MIAEVADHDLIFPPASVIGNSEQTNAWASAVDFEEIDGAIISLDSTDSERRFELIKRIRAQRPAIPIYGFLSRSETYQSGIELAGIELAGIELVAGRSLDFLLISAEDITADNRRGASLTKLKNEVASRRLDNRILFNDSSDSATNALLARMINIRFGFAPRILPVYSSSSERDGQTSPVQDLINHHIRLMNGAEPQRTSDGARGVDVLLFVHTSQTQDQERAAFAQTIAQTIDKNVRISVVDLAESKKDKEGLIADLRRRKLLDKLASYASLDPNNEKPGESITRALAQSSSFLVSIRFLRDDVDRIRRFDRAQVSLLLSRYLSDWIFPLLIRPELQSQIRDQGKRSDEIETSAHDQIKPFADGLFDDQFKNNIHALLLSYGERAQFGIRLLQRLNFRLFYNPESPQAAEVAIKPSIYTVNLGNVPVPQLRSQKTWLNKSDDLDERIARRMNGIDWQAFKTDTEMVELTTKVTSQTGANSQDGYSILSKRSRETRRIEIIAPTAQGAFYALGKLEQMGADGQLAQDFQINEKPASAQRAIIESSQETQWSHLDRLEMIRFLGRVRMNRYYYVPNDRGATITEQKVRELIQESDENFVRFFYGIRLDPSATSLNDHEFASFANRLDRLVAAGVRRFAVVSDNAQTANRIREYLKRFTDVEVTVVNAPTPSAKSDARPGCFSLKPGDLSSLDESGSDFVMSARNQLQMTKLIVATASDYAWYGRNNDPARAFNSALNLLYDERSEAGVRVWSQILGDCANGKSLEPRLNELRAAVEAIGGTRERGLLRGEMARFVELSKSGN